MATVALHFGPRLTDVFRDAPGNGVEGGHEADDGSDLRWRCFDDAAVDALRMVTEL